MENVNEKLKDAVKMSQSIEEMTGELISDYYKLKLALTQIKSQLNDRGGFEILVKGIEKTLKEVS